MKPVPCAFAILVTIVLLIFGAGRAKAQDKLAGKLRVALIQGNIPQDIKWNFEVRDKILAIYGKLTELASFDQPHLIIWPEAAFPGYFNRDIEATLIKELIKRIQIPIVVGSPHFEPPDQAYNSAYLLDAQGEVKDRYDKMHLVPFGEYVPLKPIFGWLEPLAERMGVSDFRAGKEPKIFEIQNGEIKFSVLICFEDIFPRLARASVQRGAAMLAVITNDAWFGISSAPYQHLDASIFRAVENGVPVVRAANTGVSAFITSRGKVIGRVTDEKGRDIFATGKKTEDLPMEKIDTFYRHAGWLFPYAALLLFVIMSLEIIRRSRK